VTPRGTPERRARGAAPRRAASTVRAGGAACAAWLAVLAWAVAAPAPARASASDAPPAAPAALARGAAPSPEALRRLHPSLRAAALDSAAPPRTVWVVLRDKGVAPGAEERRALAAALGALSERSLRRRLRAGMSPPVDVHDLPLYAPYLEALAALGHRPIAASRWLNRVAVRADGAALAGLASLPFVAAVRPAPAALRAPEPPAGPPPALPPGGALASRPAAPGAALDPGRNRAALVQIGATALHDSGHTGAGVLVAVFDEGFNGFDVHEALAPRRPAPGHVRDFVEGDTVVTDAGDPFGFDHGTQVLGPLAGAAPGAYLGAAPGVSLALARTETADFERRVEMHWWAMAAEWADSLGADVISSSVGYSLFDPPEAGLTPDSLDGATAEITVAARIAAARGMLVVNSAGNAGASPWRSVLAPADAHGDSVLAVGAVDAFGALASFSSLGPTADGRIKPDLVALGVSNPTPEPGGPAAYGTHSGTSFSAPLVAGLAACLLGARPQWRPVDVIAALKGTASRAGAPDNRYGWGLPNGGAALCVDPAAGPAGLPPPPGKARLLGPNPLVAGGPPVRVRFTVGGVIAGDLEGRAEVHDAAGRRVRTLWRGPAARGQCVDVAWDGRGAGGERAVPGIYYISLSAGGETSAVRVVALR